jgi:hypothetical protein
MIRIVVCSGLLVAFTLQTAIPTHAAESKQNTAACETVVEIATAAAGYGIARANRLRELGRTLATALGDKVGSKFISRYVCGADDEKPDVTSPLAPSPLAPSPMTRPSSPGYLAPGDLDLRLKSDGRECLTLRCLGITSPSLQRTLDDFRNDIHNCWPVRLYTWCPER